MKRTFQTLFCSLLACCFLSCGEHSETIPTEPEKPEEDKKPEVPEEDKTVSFINCSYIRGDFYELGNVSAESMNACTDLIYLEASSYANGDITYNLPHNDAVLGTEATHVAEFQNHKGVVRLSGKGSINCGGGLLDSPRFEASKGFNQFSVGTYIYLDEWTAGAAIFEKANQGPFISLRLDKKEGNLRLILNSFNSEAIFENTGLKPGTWQHLTFTFNTANNKKEMKVYVDNQATDAKFTKPFNEQFFKNARGVFYLGGSEKGSEHCIKGYLDETFVSAVDTKGRLGQSPIQFNNWNNGKVLTYWKFDDASHPGKDSHSWLTRLENIRRDLAGNDKVKLRLGVNGNVKSQDWKQMISKPESRANFAKQLKEIVQKHQLAGIDLDLEWASTAQEFADYSATILKLREVLGKDCILTASMHPISYKISKAAINVLDFISLQCYGPQPTWLPYDKFIECGDKAIAYGIPKEKLVMGVPFYGTSGKNEVAYRNFFPQITNTQQNSVEYKGATYYFDNLDRMTQKVQHVCASGYAGVMSWDLATDLEYTHERSLLKCVDKVLKSKQNK